MTKWVRTGRTRLHLIKRLFRTPLVGVQTEWEDREYYANYPKTWTASDLEGLTVITGLYPKITSSNLRYRAYPRLLRETWLVLQICDDPDSGRWRDARVEDLGEFTKV